MDIKTKIMGQNLRPVSADPLKNQRGSVAVDYAVILVFVVLVVVAVMVSLENRSKAIFTATAGVVGGFGNMPPPE